ncbi:hypothetical protein QEW_4410 [Clostridioides difficile CD160]|nr:hypothetical protein QEW_4410 [Clostridioides difficile CD160]
MKKISELEDCELKKLFRVNSKLRKAVSDSYEESQMYVINRILEYIKDSFTDYSIKFNNKNFISVRCKYKFIMKLKEFFDSDFYPKLDCEQLVNDALQLYNKFENAVYFNEEYCNNIYKLNLKIKELENIVLRNFNEMTNIDEDFLLYIFVNSYVEENLNDKDFYIDENFVLYEVISYL